MGFLKAQWRVIVFSLACLASIAGGAWAYMAGAEIEDKMKAISRLTETVQRLQRNAVNRRTIEEKRKRIESHNARLQRALEVALETQKYNAFYEELSADGQVKRSARRPLIDGVLPEVRRSADAIRFKNEYQRAFSRLRRKVRGRGPPTREEIDEQASVIRSLKQPEGSTPKGPWGPVSPTPDDDSKPDSGKKRTRAELLREYAKARAAEQVAREHLMYVDDSTFGLHPMAEGEEAPSVTDVWQAQMSLWIQQDMATALARCNEKRVAELVQEGRPEDAWVAHMPVKHLKVLSIDNRLGMGGGSNIPNEGFAVSFTGIKNDKDLFVVPLQLVMVVEEAALPSILEELSRVGFYTPVSVSYKAVEPNPLQESYLYGEDPVIELTLDLEGYFFRKAFEPWIPKELKKVLERPDAYDLGMGRTGRRGGR